MELSNLKPKKGARHAKKRVGRGAHEVAAAQRVVVDLDPAGRDAQQLSRRANERRSRQRGGPNPR